MDRLRVTSQQWLTMRRCVDTQAPLEACGLLAGKGNAVEEVLTITNSAASPSKFMMEPREQLAAFQCMEQRELELIGIFHSHPQGPEGMSATDIAEAAYEAIHVIWSRAGGDWQVHAYQLTNGQPLEVPLEVTDRQ